MAGRSPLSKILPLISRTPLPPILDLRSLIVPSSPFSEGPRPALPFGAIGRDLSCARRFTSTLGGSSRRFVSSGCGRKRCIRGVSVQVEDVPGALMDLLENFAKRKIQLTRLHTAPSTIHSMFGRNVISLYFEVPSDPAELDEIMGELGRHSVGEVRVLPKKRVPWFPTSRPDLELFRCITMKLSCDHPGSTDPVYVKRRNEIAAAADLVKGIEDEPPLFEYTKTENETWRTLYRELKELHPRLACHDYIKEFSELEAAGILKADAIPQLRDVGEYVKKKSGFTLRPVTGLLSERDFLNALAFRVFFSTQYIRHHSAPLYTPEPDICHELLGHAVMLCNTDFADFNQMVGLASLGASDEEVRKLASCYWFSVEFGLLFGDGELRAYGAGLVSSFGEMKYATSPTNSEIVVKPWDCDVAANQEYTVTEYQKTYFYASSLSEAKDKLLEYCERIHRPFHVSYDINSQSILTDAEVECYPSSIKS